MSSARPGLMLFHDILQLIWSALDQLFEPCRWFREGLELAADREGCVATTHGNGKSSASDVLKGTYKDHSWNQKEFPGWGKSQQISPSPKDFPHSFCHREWHHKISVFVLMKHMESYGSNDDIKCHGVNRVKMCQVTHAIHADSDGLINWLVQGNNYRKIPYFMGRSMVSCKFSLKSTHWIQGVPIIGDPQTANRAAVWSWIFHPLTAGAPSSWVPKVQRSNHHKSIWIFYG